MKLDVIALSTSAQVRLSLSPAAQALLKTSSLAWKFDYSVRFATLVIGLAALDLMIECRCRQLWIVPITEPYRRRVESLIARISRVR